MVVIMKKTMLIVCIFAIALLIPASATSISVDQSMDEFFAPYQEVIDKLNEEFGCTIYIPEDGKEEVYVNIKDTSLENFEANLRSQLSKTLLADQTAHQENSASPVLGSVCRLPFLPTQDIMVSPLVQPRSVREDIVQQQYLDEAAYVNLYSTVMSGSGTVGSFYYTDINGVSSGWIKGTGTFFFVPNLDQCTYSLDSSKKQCTLTFPCSKRNDDGLFLLGLWNLTITFVAG